MERQSQKYNTYGETNGNSRRSNWQQDILENPTFLEQEPGLPVSLRHLRLIDPSGSPVSQRLNNFLDTRGALLDNQRVEGD